MWTIYGDIIWTEDLMSPWNNCTFISFFVVSLLINTIFWVKQFPYFPFCSSAIYCIFSNDLLNFHIFFLLYTCILILLPFSWILSGLNNQHHSLQGSDGIAGTSSQGKTHIEVLVLIFFDFSQSFLHSQWFPVTCFSLSTFYVFSSIKLIFFYFLISSQ